MKSPTEQTSALQTDSIVARRTAIAALLCTSAVGASGDGAKVLAESPVQSANWLNVKSDFDAQGNGTADDTDALQKSIDKGSERQLPIFIPPGCYKISRALTIPSNTMLVGSSPGLGFGCRIEPTGCSAFQIGGARESFHCSIEDLMIWPKGKAPEFLISIDNSYSVTIRNLRIHESQHRLKRAAILLLGDVGVGGHGSCNNIIWDNLIVRNDNDQPPVAIFAAKGCGSHRFNNPCLENFGTLIEWQGGQLDIVTPYTERAGKFGINCNIDDADSTAYLNTFGGVIATADSGLGCAIRESTKNFNSFGTRWGEMAERAAYVYGLPTGPVNFHGVSPNFTNSGKVKFSGIAGWRNHVNFPSQCYKASKPLHIRLEPETNFLVKFDVPGVEVGEFSASAAISSDLRGIHLTAYVSNPDEVTAALWNPTRQSIQLDGVINISCEMV